MLTDTELLGAIRQATLMGRSGIEDVMRYSACRPLTDALRQQKAEYGELLSEANAMLKERGALPEPLPLRAKMAQAMSRTKNRLSPPTTSDIAELMISGNTKGVISSLRCRKQYLGKDDRVAALGKKLLETEHRNIEQMKPFL